MNIFRKLANLARSPTNFFKIADAEPVSMSILAYTIIILINTIITAPIAYFWKTSMSMFDGIPFSFGFVEMVVHGALTLAQHFFSVIIIILLVHGFARLLKGDGEFSATVKAVLYPSALIGLIFLFLSVIFGIIIAVAFTSANDVAIMSLAVAGMVVSIISLGLAIWSVVLVVKGIKVLHALSTGKAILAGFVLPFLVFIIIGLLFGATIIALIGGV